MDPKRQPPAGPQPGPAVPETTARPPAPTRAVVGLEQLLCAAAAEPAFAEALCRERGAAAAARGYVLSPAEVSTLHLIPEAQLRTAIARLDTSPANVQRRSFLRAVAASAVAIAAGGAVQACRGSATAAGPQPELTATSLNTPAPGGARPDWPPPEPPPVPPPDVQPTPPVPPSPAGGARPDWPEPEPPAPVPAGIRPDPPRPPTPPDEPVPNPFPGVTPGAPEPPEVPVPPPAATRGIRPDVPVPAPPVSRGIAPDDPEPPPPPPATQGIRPS